MPCFWSDRPHHPLAGGRVEPATLGLTQLCLALSFPAWLWSNTSSMWGCSSVPQGPCCRDCPVGTWCFSVVCTFPDIACFSSSHWPVSCVFLFFFSKKLLVRTLGWLSQ